MIQMITAVIGGIVIIVGLIGFARSIWSRPPKRERDEDLPRNFPPGGLGAIRDPIDNSDAGGHGGANS